MGRVEKFNWIYLPELYLIKPIESVFNGSKLAIGFGFGEINTTKSKLYRAFFQFFFLEN